ncbi:MAG: peptide/nickel transport system substrate-binding protein [Parcubacteria group bacterium Athens1014_10]|nr:MAG: peptide/nickel transport system substrate-binding protein [Parcubacteria group bacterium Athens1014_10]TSD04686.1 MAG: peptide/nickel transport system substrate-binding protein [Parcubacteria group bacterium Athens0714_12]
MTIPKIKQFKYISHFLESRERLCIKTLWLVIFLSLIFLSVRFYFIHLKLLPAKGGEYSETLVGNPKYINPVLAPANEVDLDISRLIFSGLLTRDKDQKLIPDLAEQYQMSEDQKTYTFFLRKDAKWHNGEKFSADDVIFTIETIQNNEFKSPLYSSFKGVKCEKVDDEQVKFILNEPYAPFLSLLTLGIIPKHLWRDFTPTQFYLAEYNLKPIGTGPFKFKSLVKEKNGVIKTYILKRNDKFYRESAFLEKFNFKFYFSYNEAIRAFKNKNANGLAAASEALSKETFNYKNFDLHSLHLSQYSAIFFNQSNNQFLKEKNIRQALSYAIDKERIIKEVLAERGEIIDGPILRGGLGYNSEIKKYRIDLDKANQLLNDLGWIFEESTAAEQESEGAVKFRKKGDEELKIILTTVEKEAGNKTAEIIKESWEKIGVKTELQLIPKEIILKEIIKPRNYQALLYGVILGPDVDPYLLWHSSQISEFGLNLANFSDKEADQVLEDGRKIFNPDTRHLKYQHFQNIMLEQMPAIFLYSSFYNYLIDKKIKGFDLENISLPSDRFIDVEKWYIKTRRGF